MTPIRILFVFSTLLILSCERVELAPPLADWQVEAIETDWVIGDEVIDLINTHRFELGLEELIKEPNLSTHLAAQHCNYMIEMGRISHDGFTDRARILTDNGAQAVGENVAFGYSSAQGVFNGWLNSSQHKDIIEGNYNHIGVGIRADKYNTKYFCIILTRK